MNEKELHSRVHTLNQLLYSNNASIWNIAKELQNQGFPLTSLWVVKLEQVIE